MLIKEKRRGERRWRSFHAWMRRLQNDWWTHGTRLNPRGVYNYMKETGICILKRGDNWKDRFYCECFEFNLEGSYRFKNTPTGKESQAAYRRNDGWHDRRIWEERNVPIEEERWTRRRASFKRRHRGGTHPYRVCCRRCGFFIEIVQVENRSWYKGAWMTLCEGCKVKDRKAKQVAA